MLWLDADGIFYQVTLTKSYISFFGRLVNSFETNDVVEDAHMIVPKIPAGVSGTALAASLLRDGWSVSYFNFTIFLFLHFNYFLNFCFFTCISFCSAG